MNKAYGPYCCFHPRELVVGICAHCLKDRLLLLLANDNNTDANASSGSAHPYTYRGRSRLRPRTTSMSLPKVFALGSSFLQRLDSRHHRPQVFSDHTSVASLDDSFISIKFEDNGEATWDSNKAATKPVEPLSTGKAVRSSSSSTTVVVAEHVKRGGVTRWRKQVVGRLLQLARWKRSADGKKAAAERSKGRGRSWIRNLTRRRHAERAW
ncbi:uncharacterized protein LOC133887888 [Phragmites australis]|uniref:uncharacterized protein LOC133887888 n=1 Tax=Phragmites australis TaxID=29695 RepID=UPI002D773ACB|nr:uncharacterized protein LOC133887888 [Phragmites australis]